MRRSGPKLTGSPVRFLLLLAVILGLGVGATATRNGLLTGLFVCSAVGPWMAIWERTQRRRESRETSSSDETGLPDNPA